ncbi:MAG: site-2 protease family protein [Armatimonadetes bacterium]|nr:site-2 protease family protein [Armatimonadota bacterium]
MGRALGFAAMLMVTGVIHALGHLLAGLLAGARIQEVSVGAGPVVFSLGRFRWRLLPVWAWVVFEPSDYEQLHPSKRLGISCGGPLANLLASLLLLLVFGVGYGRIVAGTDFDIVHRVFPGSPAERAGLLPGDRLLEISGDTVLLERGQERLQLKITPQSGPRPLGVKLRPALSLEPLSREEGFVYGLRLAGHLLLAPLSVLRGGLPDDGLLPLPEGGALVGPSAWRSWPLAGCILGLATVQLWFFLLNLVPLPGTDACRAALQLAQWAGIPVDCSVETRLGEFGVIAFGTAYGLMLVLLALVG